MNNKPWPDFRVADMFCNRESCSHTLCMKRRASSKKRLLPENDQRICLSCKQKIKETERDGAYHKQCRPESNRS